MSNIFTALQAFSAVTKFLDEYYNNSPSDDLAVLLGSMQFLDDNETADPAIWEEWIESVGKNQLLTQLQVFDSMKKFLKGYSDLISSKDIKVLLDSMQLSKDDMIQNATIRRLWIKCVSEALAAPKDTRSYLQLIK